MRVVTIEELAVLLYETEFAPGEYETFWGKPRPVWSEREEWQRQAKRQQAARLMNKFNIEIRDK